MLHFDAVALHLIVKRGPMNPEHLGGLQLIAVRFGERLQDRVPLAFVQL